MHLPRTLEPVLRRAAKEFPAVVLTGPRQSGKTTLLRHLFGSAGTGRNSAVTRARSSDANWME